MLRGEWEQRQHTHTLSSVMREGSSEAQLKLLDAAGKAVAVAGSSVELLPSHSLFGLFACNIALRIPRQLENTIVSNSDIKSNSVVLNIQIERAHKRVTEERFCTRRDRLLAERGVIVKRIESDQVIQMAQSDLEKWILASVADASQSRCHDQIPATAS